MIEKLKDKHFLLALLFSALFIILIWFQKGELIAGGEEGLWIFNPSRSMELFSSGWVEIGTGYATAAYLPRAPILLFLAVLGKILSPWQTQAVLFFLIMLSGVVGMYYLAREFLGDKDRWVAWVISTFYLLNTYSMTQIWNRLIYAGMFSWSYLPIIFFLSIKWLKTRKILYLILIFTSSVIYSAAFVTISFVFAIWIPILLYIFYILWERRKSIKSVITISLSTIILVGIWLLANIWWIYPFFSTTGTAFGQFVDLLDMNLATLQGVSQYFTTDQIILLRQAYFFSTGDGRDSFWSDFYQSPLAYFLGYIGLSMVIVGIVFVYKSHKSKSYLLSLLFIGWVIVKGSNPPFGYELYKFLFSNLKFTMMFRNPYEKLGLIFLLPYSFLFGLGVYTISKRLGKRKLFFVVTILTLVCGILVWPIWTGDVYTSRIRLNVPNYYVEANRIINNDSLDARIIFLPLINGEAAFYKWEYMGAVPVDFLFDKPAVSRPISSVYPYFQDLLEAFSNKDRKAVHRLFEELNIGYVVIVSDLEEGRNNVTNPWELLAFLSNDSKLQYLGKAGELIIYRVENEKVGKRMIAEGEKTPTISYKKLSPVKYVVDVESAEQPFSLIFKNSYNDLWEARVNDRRVSAHSLAYGYANSWKIDQKGSYTITVSLRTWPW